MTQGIGATLSVLGYQIALSPADVQGLNLTFTNASGEDIGTRHNDSARDLTVLSTAISDAATGYAGMPFDNEQLKTWTKCTISTDGIDVFTGSCKVSGCIRRQGMPYSYTISFLGSASDWQNALGVQTVNGLPPSLFSAQGYDPAQWVWDESHYLDDPSDSANLIGWLPVNFGQWKTFGKVDWSEFVPQIRKSAIMKAIFNSIGWQVVSNWMTVDDFWHFWTGSQLRPIASTIADYGLRVSDSTGNNGTFSVPVGMFSQFPFVFDTDSPLPDYNPTGAFAITGTDWTVPVTRKYRLRAYITSDAYGNTVDVRFWNATTGSYVPLLTYDYLLAAGGVITTDTIQFTAGDIIQVVVNGVTFIFPLPYSFNAGSWFEVVPDPGLNYGDTLDPACVINEDVTCTDYLAGLTHTSNLYFGVDAPSKTIYIEPRDTWTAADRTRQPGFFELHPPQLIEVDENRDVRFSFNDDVQPLTLEWKSDSLDWFLNLTLTKRPLFPFASAIFNMGGYTSDQIQRNENRIFKAFCLIADQQVATGGGSPVPVFPRIWKAEADGLDYAGDYPPRAVSWMPVCAYSVVNNGSFNYVKNSGATTTLTKYVYSTMMPISNTSGKPMKTLAFGNQIDDLGNVVVGRMQDFYLRNLISKRIGITANVRAIVGAFDLCKFKELNWQFRFSWEGRNWTMIALKDFNQANPTTELEMLADRQPTVEDLLLITAPNDGWYKNP